MYGLNYAPELTGIGKYTGDLCSWLADRGHEVRVVTAPPYYPEWRVRKDYRGGWYRVERAVGGPVVYRTPLYVPARPSGWKRVLHLGSFMLGSLPVMLRQILWKPDVVFTVEPTFFGAPLALLVARMAGAKSWLHVQDFEVEAAFDLGLLPTRGPARDLALALERFFTRSFARVSSISTKMVERLEGKGVDPGRRVLFPNWVDVAGVRPLDGENLFRRELGLDGKVIVLYSGNMGNKQGLELLGPLAQAFAPGGAHEDAQVHFVFCGTGAFRERLEEVVAGLNNVALLPLQPLELLNSLLNAADVHLLPQRAGAADLVMPSKMTGMLASGRCVLATAEVGTQVATVVDDGVAPCGMVVPAEDHGALCAALELLVRDRAMRVRLGENARDYAVKFLGRDEVLLAFERELRLLRT